MSADDISASAAGALAAQRAIAELRDPDSNLDVLWLRMVEVAAEFGWKSAGLPAFVREVAKAIRN
jgi:hypothetical protein